MFVAMFMITSCYKEDPIIPTSSDSGNRFIFPQGNNNYDARIKKVYDDFGVKIIYKGYQDKDFNLSWTNAGIGRTGRDVTENQREAAVNYVVDHIFGNITPQLTRKVLPPYFYVADSITQLTVFSNTLESLSAITYIYNGLDFWSFTWNGAIPYNKNLITGITTYSASSPRPTTPFYLFYKRGVMLKEIFKAAINNGNIKVPENFNSGLDFSTATINTTGMEDNVNYYKKRGFPGQMTLNTNFNFSTLALITRTSAIQNFIDYVHLCMRYTPDSIEVNYPIAKYPIIHQKYPIVIKYMKDNYNIDLNKIATKPQI